MSLLPILVIVVLFYIMIIRPNARRRQAAAAVSRAVEVGAEVMTTAGLFGTVTAVEGDKVWLQIAPGVVVQYMAAAIAQVIEPEVVSPENDLSGDGLPKNSGHEEIDPLTDPQRAADAEPEKPEG